MNDERLSAALESLPRERAGAGFTAAVLPLLPPTPGHSSASATGKLITLLSRRYTP